MLILANKLVLYISHISILFSILFAWVYLDTVQQCRAIDDVGFKFVQFTILDVKHDIIIDFWFIIRRQHAILYLLTSRGAAAKT